MKILALQGSPRKDGNTQALLEMVLDSAAQAGADTETVQLIDLKNLTGCMECYACQQKASEPACAIDDDMQPVLDKVLAADLIIWATPVFCWSPAWLMKMALDRLFCTFKFGDDDVVECLLEGRKMAAVITAGGGEDEGAHSVRDTCRHLAEFANCTWLGAFVAANVKSPEAIRADAALAKRARDFGRQLAS